jgi:hypothetical protein
MIACSVLDARHVELFVLDETLFFSMAANPFQTLGKVFLPEGRFTTLVIVWTSITAANTNEVCSIRKNGC